MAHQNSGTDQIFRDVSILMPVFNEEEGIEQAIRSAAPQCEALIISDNASTDNTAAICKKLMLEYPNISYTIQDRNIGSFANGKFLLSKLNTDYFMWMGGHDYLSENYISTLKQVLTTGSDTILAAGVPASFSRKGPSYSIPSIKTSEMSSSSSFDRVEFIAKDGLPKYGGFIGNGLYKTDAFRSCMDDNFPLFGNDILLLARIASIGKIVISESAVYHCETRLEGSQGKYLKRVFGKDVDLSSVRQSRSEYAQYMYRIAKSVAVTNSEKLRLLNIKMHLFVNYGVFGDNSVTDRLCRILAVHGKKIARKLFLAPGSETSLENALYDIKKIIGNNRKIALYGAGLHTRRLLSSGIMEDCAIVAIFDDFAKPGTTISDIPVLSPAASGSISFEILLISSDTIEKTLYRNSKKWIPEKIKVLRLYS